MVRFFMRVILIFSLLAGYLQSKPTYASNYWSVGSTVGLCEGTEIRHGSGYGYAVHTRVPHNNWPVRVIDGPRYISGQVWWDISRREIDGGGTGWVVQSDADRCYSSPPPSPPSDPAPPSPPPSNPPDTCQMVTIGPFPPVIVGPTLTHRPHPVVKGFLEYEGTISGRYCEKSVTIYRDGMTFRIHTWEVSLDYKSLLDGVSKNVAGVDVGPGWDIDRKQIWVAMGLEDKKELNLSKYPEIELQYTVDHEGRYVFEFDPPQCSDSCRKVVLVVVVIAVVVATPLDEAAIVVAAIRAAIARALGPIFGLALTRDIPLEELRDEVLDASGTHTDFNPELFELLSPGYGPMLDTVNLRAMEVQKTQSLQMRANGTSLDSLTSIDFSADGFAPGANVLVMADRAGRFVSETSVHASSTGNITGSLLLSAAEATQEGILTIVAMDKEQIDQRFVQIITQGRNASRMDVAAASVAIAPSPRLIGNVTFDPWPIVAGRPTTATYTVQNFGDIPITLKRLVLAVRGPDCPNWCNDKGADWPTAEDITLQPGATYKVSNSRSIEQPGEYVATVAYQDINENWHDTDASHRFEFSVQPGIIIQEPLTISPTHPIAGEVVTVQFRIKNDSSETLSLARVMATGRGPDCTNGWECTGFGDAPVVHSVQLGPGQEYAYNQRRLFTEEGDYFIQPMYQFTDRDWHLIGSRLDFQVQPGVRVVEPLRLVPPLPVAGQTVKASYTLRNDGNRAITIPYIGVMARGPDCTGTGWECPQSVDWPWVSNVRFEPGEEYRFESTRILGNAGEGYWAEPHLADQNPWWLMADDGQRLSFRTQQGLSVIEPLQLEPPDPVVGEPVYASFSVRNNSNSTLTTNLLVVGTRGPNCTDWNCTHSGDFPAIQTLRLLPGQEYMYEGQHVFSVDGEDYFAQMLTMPDNGYWSEVGDKKAFDVSPGLSLLDSVTLSPTEPIAGEPVTVEYTLKNHSNRSLKLTWLGVSAAGPDCTEPGCGGDDWVDFPSQSQVTIEPGGVYVYREARTYASPGVYRLQPFFTVSDSWRQIPGASVMNLTVRPGIKLLQDVSLEPPDPQVGELVKARFTIQNNSERVVKLAQVAAGARGPNCIDWDCGGRDFGWEKEVVLEAGEVYAYENTQVFAESGNGHFVQPYIKFGEDDWTPLGNRVPFSISQGLVLIDAPSITPQVPQSGEVVRARYSVRNAGQRALTFRWLGISGGGPNCDSMGCAGWADFPSKQNLTLNPGQTFSFDESRFYLDPGRYIYQPAFDVGGWWTVFGESGDFEVSPGLEVTEELSLTPANPAAGESVLARYSIRNTGTKNISLPQISVGTRGPNCTDWNCTHSGDFPGALQVELAPSDEYTFESRRTFNVPGNDYFAHAWFTNTLWSEIGVRRTFSVTPGLSVDEEPVTTPKDPVVGELVTATVKVRNMSSRPISMKWLGITGGGPNCDEVNCGEPSGYPAEEGVTVAPGDIHTWTAARVYTTPGEYFLQPVFADSNEWWSPLPNSQRITITISPGLELLEPLSITPSTVMAGEIVTARGVLRNQSDKPVTLYQLGVPVRGPDCNEWDCTDGADFYWEKNLTIQPGQTYVYEHQRAFPLAGDGYHTRFAFQSGEKYWTTLGSDQSFEVLDGLQLIHPLTLSPQNPKVGETVEAHYSIRNSSDRPLMLPALGVVVRGPDGDTWDDEEKWADFPVVENIALSPGETYNYSEERTFSRAGSGYIADAAFADTNPWWYEIAGNQRFEFVVTTDDENSFLYLPFVTNPNR